jgi:sec-independent protein translocase protein TatA
MPNIGAPELIVILVIALLIIGPGKLPDVGSALGKSIREFRKASSDVQDAAKIYTSPTPPAPSETAAPAAPAGPAASGPMAPPEPNVLHTPSAPAASDSTADSNR